MSGHAAVTLMTYLRIRASARWRNRASFERWQEKQVLRALAFVKQRSPFYRQWWGERPLAQWREFPLIDKAVMMEHFDRLNTAGIRKEQAMETALTAERTRDFRPRIGNVTVGLSSGTSGSRGLFLVSDREQAAWAGAVLAKMLPGPLWKPERIAFFLRANSNLYESVRRGRLQFEYFDLLEPLERHAERLERYRPGIVAAPPSVLRLLAEEKLAGRLAAQPHRIVSVAEVLDPLDACVIERAFGPLIHQIYQCTEGFLASTCRYGTLHLNEDIVHIDKEKVAGDPSGRKFVPIVTDFSRRTQPIIRYRLNDLLTEAAAPCPCGSVFTAVERIEGRCDDIFYLENASGALVPVFPDLIARAVIASSPAIAEYRVIQEEARAVRVELALSAGADRAETEREAAASVAALLQRMGCRVPELRFDEYRFAPGMSKLRRVERSWRIERAGHSV